MKIGGSMGPLYGYFFKSMASACDGVDLIDAGVFGRMLTAGKEGIQQISSATPGDKTLMDVLVPAEAAYHAGYAWRSWLKPPGKAGMLPGIWWQTWAARADWANGPAASSTPGQRPVA